MKSRLDVLLVAQGFAPSREKARTMLMSGIVYVNGNKEDKAGSQFDPAKITIEVRGHTLPYVSRGGLKLEKALQVFPIDLHNKVCMDIGASTGGFTDCMLQSGAAYVYAIDVGYGQLAWKLREDPRVCCLEKTNFRYLKPEDLPPVPKEVQDILNAQENNLQGVNLQEGTLQGIDFASCDVSFISLSRILPAAWPMLKPGAQMVCLIKPQFEAGRDKVGKKGVVRDPSVHEEVIRQTVKMAAGCGFTICGLDYSPIRGPEGNIEFLLLLQKPLFSQQAAPGLEQTATRQPVSASDPAPAALKQISSSLDQASTALEQNPLALNPVPTVSEQIPADSAPTPTAPGYNPPAAETLLQARIHRVVREAHNAFHEER